PWKTLTIAIGKSAIVTKINSRARSDQPPSVEMSLALDADGFGNVWRRETIQLRHDVTSCFSLRRTVRWGQCLIAIENSNQCPPCASDAALHRANSAIADLCGFLIGKS